MNKEANLLLDELLVRKGIRMYRAINHPLRQRILQLLHGEGRMMVKDIYTFFGIEQSVASQHLAILRNAGMVKTAREGAHIYYAPHLEQIEKMHCFSEQLIG